MKYLYFVLSALELEKMIVGIGVPGINRNDVYQRLIPIPDLKTQQTLVAEIEILEQHINTAQTTINTAAAKKQAVLKKYL